jgi:PAS domain-containing protein
MHFWHTSQRRAPLRHTRRPQDFVLPEYHDSAATWLADAFRGKDTRNADLAVRAKSGARVDLLLSISSRTARDGAAGAVAVGHDITLRKRAEGRAEHELQAFIAEANAPIFGIDPGMNVTVWNSSLVAITGHSAEEVIGEDRQVRAVRHTRRSPRGIAAAGVAAAAASRARRRTCGTAPPSRDRPPHRPCCSKRPIA